MTCYFTFYSSCSPSNLKAILNRVRENIALTACIVLTIYIYKMLYTNDYNKQMLHILVSLKKYKTEDFNVLPYGLDVL